MCNAQNHSPDCTCGFGGGYGAGGYGSGYGSLRTASPFRAVSLADGFLWRSDHKTTRESYTVPNAKCPVCGATVFFYQSPYGGRVFFDDIGPPWLKHQCTDNYFRSWPGPSQVEKPVLAGRRDLSRFKDGWKPLCDITVSDSTDEFQHFLGVTHDPQGIHQLAVRKSCNVNFDGPIFCRRTDDGRWEMSWIPSSPTYLKMEPQVAIAIPFYWFQPIARRRTDIEVWELALRGDPAAQNMVGMLLTFARDTEKSRKHSMFPGRCDWAAAKMWFEASAATGYLPAMNNLGVMYERGYGVEKNPDLAFKLYSQAAESMAPVSINHLADCYEQGIGSKADPEMAAYLRDLASISKDDDDEDESEGTKPDGAGER